jgi:hypothetical protein
MRLFRGYHLLLSVIALAAPLVAVIDRVAERIATFVLSMFAPAQPRFAIDDPAFERSVERPALARALLESLRHEKGVPRFGAARNI